METADNSPMGDWGALLDLLSPSTVVLIGQGAGVVYYAAIRSLAHEAEMETSKNLEEIITLDSRSTLLIPIFSSFSLLLIFYFFSTISFVLTCLCIVACGFSLAFVIAPFVNRMSMLALSDPLRQKVLFNFLDLPVTPAVALMGLVSSVTTISWVVTGYWTLNNVLGMALCITYVSFIRLPNVKVCALLLGCLFFYDIFWVFISSRIFGDNVMVAVATKQAENPVRAVANTFHLPVPSLVSARLDLPVKLMVPRLLFEEEPDLRHREFLMLGLGDMALPGMLLALVMSFDDKRRRRQPMGVAPSQEQGRGGITYLRLALGGYLVGLTMSMAAGVMSRAAQPALLYIVPCTLIPVTTKAWMQHELLELWQGPWRVGYDVDAEKNVV
mmetsp:Transcript_38060/g.82737  ORF Transcript_38060/g.82737 Transcript_38060/m.82737 type:complete len:385 (-) Transcript_38060:706-1860(-)|eukprot:CAMPEP_0118924252 /NCGR_PEP_ID=MMETSP1169-20130426/2469_1 /TAXON_ID=36882 /ORGANISM="Pyramimonas obovata, Strain CCMP722" /LENGTH=384 /DNA_ID=CAMNT_0006865347 /DNA_START=31 /DNA_END=1185 /DNA_ORIENTATION=-